MGTFWGVQGTLRSSGDTRVALGHSGYTGVVLGHSVGFRGPWGGSGDTQRLRGGSGDTQGTAPPPARSLCWLMSMRMEMRLR